MSKVVAFDQIDKVRASFVTIKCKRDLHVNVCAEEASYMQLDHVFVASHMMLFLCEKTSLSDCLIECGASSRELAESVMAAVIPAGS